MHWADEERVWRSVENVPSMMSAAPSGGRGAAMGLCKSTGAMEHGRAGEASYSTGQRGELKGGVQGGLGNEGGRRRARGGVQRSALKGGSAPRLKKTGTRRGSRARGEVAAVRSKGLHRRCWRKQGSRHARRRTPLAERRLHGPAVLHGVPCTLRHHAVVAAAAASGSFFSMSCRILRDSW